MVLLQHDEILEELSRLQENHYGHLVSDSELPILLDNKEKLFNIFHLNIRSIQKNFDNLILLLQSFNLTDCDILVLSECFQISSPSQFYIPGYESFYNSANYNKNDGVVIMIRQNILAEVLHTKLTKSQATISRITCNIKNTTIGISAVYKPPSIDKQAFIQDIQNFFETLPEANIIEILTGDINIDITDRNNNDATEYLAMMANKGFVPYINRPTRSESGTCLDHMFVKQNINCYNFSSFILDTHVTDHYPIMLHINYKQNNIIMNKNISIKKTSIDSVKLISLLHNHNWENVTKVKDVNTATENFINTVESFIKRSENIHEIAMKQNKKIKSWITNGLIESIRHRDKLKKKLLKNYSIELDIEYKNYRNALNKLIVKQKNTFYKNKINNNKNNIKKIYEIIKDATNESEGDTRKKICIKNSEGNDFKTTEEMANYCNNHFINMAKDMATKIPVPTNPYEIKSSLTSSMFLTPIKESELIKHISTLKNNCTPGHDNITSKLIKQTHKEILKPLLYIINLIFETGIVPKHFKYSIVTPIYKSGTKSCISNYRPISVISNFAKLFEKCLKDRLLTFLKQKNIMSSNQYGFLEGLSTTDAMCKLTTEIVDNLNIGNKCIGVFLDLAKAFDTVPHDNLLHVLHQYGVRGTVWNLIKNYLSDRYQKLKVNNTFSKNQKIQMGIPQGTVMGPILFIIYMNSLLTLEVSGTLISYADDTVVLFKGKNWEETKEKTQLGLDRIKHWLESFKLTLNLSKTSYMAFSITSANRPNFSHISINNCSIQEVSHVKYLGIIIDKHLKWNYHINHLTQKIRKLVYKFYLLRSILNRQLLITIYKALIESIIRYGILVWGGMYKNGIQKLLIIQKYILKTIYFKNKTYPTSLLYSIETSDVRTLYITTVCNHLHNHDHLKTPLNHHYSTRNVTNSHVSIPLNHKSLQMRHLNYLGPKMYNIIPSYIKCYKSKLFTKQCHNYVYHHMKIFNELLN